MQEYIRPFQVKLESTQSLAVTGSSQSITLGAYNGNASIRIVVVGTQTVFWNYDAAAATATSTPMLANTIETFFLPAGTTTIRFIAAATGSTVYVTVGESA